VKPGDPIRIRHWAPEQAATSFRGTYLGRAAHSHLRVRWEEGPLRGREARVPAGQVRPC
jgi:hypothetical protein